MTTKKIDKNELSLDQLEKVNGGGDVPTTTVSFSYAKVGPTYGKDSKSVDWSDFITLTGRVG